MKRLRHWISARLWRRLAFSHFGVVLVTMSILQLAVATLLGLTVRGTAPIEGDAGWLALQLAQVAGHLMDADQEDAIPAVVEMLHRQIVLPGEVELAVDVPGFYIKTGNEPINRLTAVTILNQAGEVVMTRGDALALTEYRSDLSTLFDEALSGETNPYKLSHWLKKIDGGLLLGVAAITRNDGEIAGIVAVEMYPSLRVETAGAAAPLIGFAGFLAVTALVGLPALIVAFLVASLSGLIVSRSLGRRLKPLEETAQKMASGDLTLRIADTSPDEIGRVGQAFDRMAERLEDSLHELEEEKEQVETLLRARRDLVANVSHDLRTPIASLAAHLETLSVHPERLDEYLSILNDETTRVSGLIADLFELSRLDAHELNLDLGPVVLPDVIAKVCASYRVVAWEQRRIVLEVHLPEALPLVQADAQRVEQILCNLITNGLRFTPEGGIITIEAEALATEVEMRVSDTGIGIAPEDLSHIFERSYKGDRSRGGDGSGLGLAIVKGLVEAMGGSVSATSTAGEGSCIYIRLLVV